MLTSWTTSTFTVRNTSIIILKVPSCPSAVNPISNPQSQATTDLLSVITVSPLPDAHINGIAQNVAFCIWLLHMFLRFIHPATCIHSTCLSSVLPGPLALVHSWHLAWLPCPTDLCASSKVRLPKSCVLLSDTLLFPTTWQISPSPHLVNSPPFLTTHCLGEEPRSYLPSSLSLRFITCEFHSR